MKTNTIKIITLFGIPIGLDPSWFLVFALITFALAVGYFPEEFKSWSILQDWSVAIVTSILFFVSVFLHELGHSIVAKRYNLPVKSITLYIFGGSSEIGAQASTAISEFVIALSGPVTSIILAAFFYSLQLLFRGIEPIYATAKYLALINAILAAFNLIPGFPLDGGRVFRAILWGITHNMQRATRIAALLGHAIAFFFILLGVWRFFQGDWRNGLWVAFTGWFLETAVLSQIQQQHIQILLAGHTVDQVMNRECAMASSQVTIQQLVDQYILEMGQRCMVIVDDDHPVGLVTLHNIRRVPRHRWNTTRAFDVMTPMEQVKLTNPKMGLAQALEQMGSDGVNQLPVIQDGQVEGLLRREDITNYLNLLQKLEG